MWLIAAIVSAIVAGTAQAHLRWFSERDKDAVSGSFLLDGISVSIVVVALVFAIAVALWASTAASRSVDRYFERLGLRSRAMEWRLLAALTGAMWLVNSSNGVFIAPNLTPHLAPGLELGLANGLQIAAAIALVAQPSLIVAGGMLMLTTVVMLAVVPPELSIDYALLFLALGAALVCVGPSLRGLDHRLPVADALRDARAERLAAPLVRVGAGATLVILAIHNKLLDPGLGLEFLEMHEFNVLPAAGLASFSDLHFVLAAAVTELTLGGLLLAGIGTRSVTLVLGAFFGTSFVLLGPVELVGHLPFFGVLIVLLLQGDIRRTSPEESG